MTAEAPDEIGPGQGARADIADAFVNRTKLKQGTSGDYLATRLKRDFPDIAAAVGRGEFKSDPPSRHCGRHYQAADALGASSGHHT